MMGETIPAPNSFENKCLLFPAWISEKFGLLAFLLINY
jgi:hypothetical protein